MEAWDWFQPATGQNAHAFEHSLLKIGIGQKKEMAKQTAKATEDISQKIAAIQADTKGPVVAIATIGARDFIERSRIDEGGAATGADIHATARLG